MASKEIAERTLRFAVRIVHIYRRMLDTGGAARALAPQLLRSAASIGANLEEATAAQSKADFIAKIGIAHKEARETVYWLRLVVAAHLLPADVVEPELDEALQLARILAAIRLSAREPR
ncbi:MAG TPA: four helix bundle protein [Vicinamibacterales bacterium]|nr:four helix bundle protein [Vicinamibacterales bacterium]